MGAGRSGRREQPRGKVRQTHVESSPGWSRVFLPVERKLWSTLIREARGRAHVLDGASSSGNRRKWGMS